MSRKQGYNPYNKSLVFFESDYKVIPILNTEYPSVQEIWKPITEWSIKNIKANTYYVSNLGRVYSTITNTLLTKVISNTGYYRVALSKKDNSTRYHAIHRIVMIEFNYIPGCEHLQVNHINGDKLCNYIWNLEWCTCQENIIHSVQMGLRNVRHGEDAPQSVITNEQADRIGYLITQQIYTNKQIADIVGCPVYIVNNISACETWVDVIKKYNLEQYKRAPRPGFTDEELHKVCAYIEANKHKYSTKTALYLDMMKDLFNEDYTAALSASLSRISTQKTRKEITEQYDMS